jgi:hypothetical protein
LISKFLLSALNFRFQLLSMFQRVSIPECPVVRSQWSFFRFQLSAFTISDFGLVDFSMSAFQHVSISAFEFMSSDLCHPASDLWFLVAAPEPDAGGSAFQLLNFALFAPF